MKYPSVTATIDPAFLSKVDRVFDASPTTVFNELLQNSRRAGATKVIVKLDSPDEAGAIIVTFEDDGRGIEDPAILLRLAAKGWDNATNAAEDPAGMGFFCLSNFGWVDIKSLGWEALAAPSTFRGEVPMCPTEVKEARKGTQIRFIWDSSSAEKIVGGLRHAAKYCGIPNVILEQHGAERQFVDVSKFLDKAKHVREFPEYGYSIGVKPAESRWASQYNMVAKLNFHGVRIDVTLEDEMFRSLASVGYDLWVDITETTDLQLVLPARNALKHNEARSALLDHCKHTILDFVAKYRHGLHSLPFSVYQHAQKLGYDLGEAEVSLSCYGGHRRSASPEDVMRTYVVVPLALSDEIVRESWNYRRDIGNRYLAVECASYEGYKWYDSLVKLEEVNFVLNDTTYPLAKFDDIDRDTFPGNDVFRWVDNIEVFFKLSDQTTLSSRPPVIVNGTDVGSYFESAFGYDRTVFVTRNIKDTEGWLSETLHLLTTIAFSASEDPEADSQETQLAEFTQDLTAALLGFVASPQDSLKYVIEEHMKKLPWSALTASWSITHNGDHNSRPVVTVDIQPTPEPS